MTGLWPSKNNSLNQQHISPLVSTRLPSRKWESKEDAEKARKKEGEERGREGLLTSVKHSKESWNQLKRWDRGRDGSRESTERLYDHQVLACVLKALNCLSGLFLPTHKASSGPEEATWQSFSEAALHPATLTDKSKGRSFLGSAVCILKRVLWSQTSFFSGNLVLTSLREEFPRRTSSYAPTKKKLLRHNNPPKRKNTWS